MARRVANHRNVEKRHQINNIVESRVDKVNQMLANFPLDNKSEMIDSQYVKEFNLPQARTVQTTIWFSYDNFDRILDNADDKPMTNDLFEVLNEIKDELTNFNDTEIERQHLLANAKNFMKIALDNYYEEDYEEDTRVAYFRIESLDYVSVEAFVKGMLEDVKTILNDIQNIDYEKQGIDYEFLYNQSASFAVFVALFPYIFETIKDAQSYIKSTQVNKN